MADPPAAPAATASLCFRGVWRDYQAQLLADADALLDDKRFHIVAAPGSGKTTLGIEIIRRIGRPAVVLAPTVTIRDQWIDRLVTGFTEAPRAPDWISHSLDDPRQLTVCTYQALHALWSAKEPATGFAELAAALRAMAPFTLVLDEAHHLRREWWRALLALTTKAGEPTIVALTATPPYDVPYDEWARYEGMCGPIDCEIAIPELVRNGDLCPHQDYLLLSTPTVAEGALIGERREGLAALFARLTADASLAAAVAEHGWLVDPEDNVQPILEQPEFLSAMLVYLAAAGREVPAAPLAVLGARRADLPAPSPRSMEALLEGLVFGAGVDLLDSTYRHQLRAELQGLGAIENGHVRILETAGQFALTANSTAKLDSIVRIARAETAALGDRLRMVVLTDQVRAGDLPRGADPGPAPAKLGVASIFDALRRAGMAKLGVLSGPLVVIPESARPALEAIAPRDSTRIAPLAHCPGYLRVTLASADNHRSVALVTQLFEAGEIEALVGTQALLGEGWDAPAVNTLVLASNTGSYMMSNQVRGRAIRIDPGDPAKVANIWHLATVTPGVAGPLGSFWAGAVAPDDPIGADLGPDMELMQRRFRAFAGVSYDLRRGIESGIGRLCLRGRSWDAASIEALDTETLARSADRATVAARWKVSIGGGDPQHVPRMRQVARTGYAPRFFALRDTLLHLVIAGLGGGVLYAANALRGLGLDMGLGTFAMAFAVVALGYALPKLAKAVRLVVRNGSLEASLRSVGETLLAAFDAADLMPYELSAYSVQVATALGGERLVSLEGPDRASERMFMAALGEVLGPVTNPRYLLVRPTRFGPRARVDYHAVPAVLGQRKELAEIFAKEWRRRVGPVRLVFTRSEEGRGLLLRARARSFAAGFQRPVDQFSAWQ